MLVIFSQTQPQPDVNWLKSFFLPRANKFVQLKNEIAGLTPQAVEQAIWNHRSEILKVLIAALIPGGTLLVVAQNPKGALRMLSRVVSYANEQLRHPAIASWFGSNPAASAVQQLGHSLGNG
jgi:hypothetical protein